MQTLVGQWGERLLQAPLQPSAGRPLSTPLCHLREAPPLGEDGQLVDLLQPDLLLPEGPGDAAARPEVGALGWGASRRQVPFLLRELDRGLLASQLDVNVTHFALPKWVPKALGL